MQGHLPHVIDLIPRLRRLAVALLHDRDTADKLVHMCLGNVSDQYGQWVAKVDVRLPLFRCLIEAYLASDWQESERRSVARGAPSASDSQYATLETLERALRQLDKREKAALLLIDLEEASYEDAAAIMDEPVKSVKAQASRAQNKLRHSMSTGSSTALDREGRPDTIGEEGP